MKTKQTIILSALILLGLTSCEKDLYDPSKNQNEKKMTDLVVPADFDWEMTTAATCHITSDRSAQLAIYLDEACSENSLLATQSVKEGTNIQLPLSLLKNSRHIYIQYENMDGKRVVAAPVDAKGMISFSVPADAIKPADAIHKRAVTRAAEDFEEMGTGTLYYPSGLSNATIFFEDNYPNIGDYDFNDFVARYSAVVKTALDVSPEGFEDVFITKIEFRMEVVAIGGITHYIPCLRLPFQLATIDQAQAEATGVDSDVLNMEIVGDKSTKNNAVFVLNGAEKNTQKKGQFLNTVREDGVARTKKVTLTITFKENKALLSDLTSNLFDLFLSKQDKSTEIHMLGYGPAFQEGNMSFLFRKGNTLYKDANTNLVWAISIPSATIKHAFETANFRSAFPTFASWAESGGIKEIEWYNQTDKDFLF